MTPEEFEPRVRAKVKERIDQGWIIMREIVRARLEVGGAETECACALGCFVEDSDACLRDAIAAAGIADGIAVRYFIAGFDGTRECSVREAHDQTYYDRWYALGCRTWDYAQELTRRRAAQRYVQRNAKEST